MKEVISKLDHNTPDGTRLKAVKGKGTLEDCCRCYYIGKMECKECFKDRVDGSMYFIKDKPMRPLSSITEQESARMDDELNLHNEDWYVCEGGKFFKYKRKLSRYKSIDTGLMVTKNIKLATNEEIPVPNKVKYWLTDNGFSF